MVKTFSWKGVKVERFYYVNSKVLVVPHRASGDDL
jgi:hypothetical protein